MDHKQNKLRGMEQTLIKNTMIIALGTFSGKVFSFLLIPLYTRVLAADDYGAVDFLVTLASLIVPILTLQLNSAVFRFVIDAEHMEGRRRIVSAAVVVELGLYLAGGSLLFAVNRFLPIENCGLYYVYLGSLIWSELVQNTVRALGNNRLYALISFLSAAISVTANLVLILLFRMDASSILWAAALANLLAGLLAVMLQREVGSCLRPGRIHGQTLRAMCAYCLPLIPNAVSWWIANASNRVIIRIFLGAAANGIFAVANKFPMLYTTVFGVFNISWTETLSRSVQSEHQTAFINRSFFRYIKLFGSISVLMIMGIHWTSGWLIGAEYLDALNHIFILFVAVFISSLCTLYGGIFVAFKKSSVIGISTLIGAAVNVTLNLLLIGKLGLYAASLSTLVSYSAILLTRVICARKLVKLTFPVLTLLPLGVAFVGAGVLFFAGNLVLRLVLSAALLAWLIFTNRDTAELLLSLICRKKG